MAAGDDRTEEGRGTPDVDRTDEAGGSPGAESGEPAGDDGAGSDPSQPRTNPYYGVHDDEGDSS